MDTPVQTIPTVETQIPENPQVPETPKDNHWITIASMALFVLLSLGVIVFLYYQNQQLKSMLASYQTPLASPTPISVATTDPTANWKTMTSDQFKFSLSYPPDWKYYNNANNDILKLPYVKNFSSQNESLVKINGCAIHFGFGGSSGPSNEIQSDSIKLDGLNLNQKTWFIQKSPVFRSYMYEDVPSVNMKFELVFAWISQEDVSSCQNEIDQILSTFKFTEATDSASPVATQKACTLEAKICTNGSSVGRSGPNCEFAACPTP